MRKYSSGSRQYSYSKKFSGGYQRIYDCTSCGRPLVGADASSGTWICYRCVQEKLRKETEKDMKEHPEKYTRTLSELEEGE